MTGRPPKAIEGIVAILIPPACRDEVTGDLHERFAGLPHYIFDALGAVPLVILSRIRRVTDVQVLLIQAFALCGSFLGAATLADRALLTQQWGLLRLAIPVVIVIPGIILDDAYARPGRRSSVKLAQGPLFGLILALLSQEMLRTGGNGVALPRAVIFCGSAMSLLLCSTIRIWFPPATEQLHGAGAPLDWLKREAGPREKPKRNGRVPPGSRGEKSAGAKLAAASAWAVTLFLVGLILYRVWNRG